MVQQRPLAVGDIEYIYIPKERSGLSVLFTPDEFNRGELSLIYSLPKNVMQLNDPFVFYSHVKKVQTFIPHHVSVVYPDNVDKLIEHNPYKHSLKVFFLHSETENLDDIISKLTRVFSPIFLACVDTPDYLFKGYESISILAPKDFIEKLKSRKAEIEAVLLEYFPKKQTEFIVDLPITEHHVEYNPSHEFTPTRVNYYTLSQILGSLWTDDDSQVEDEDDRTKVIKVSDEMEDPSNTDRFKLLIDQINRMSDLEIMVLNDRNVKFPNGNQEGLSPLVLVLPFTYPTLGEFYGTDIDKDELKRLKKALNHEQAINYKSYTSARNLTTEDFKYHVLLQYNRATYLDAVAYLHASFTYSPVLRFPMLGNAIKGELSFFKPATLPAKWQASKEHIDRFGRKLASLILPSEFADDILGLPRQIVAVTDLPIEWLLYKKHNLCFTHDITRIPETPYGGIMAAFRNNTFVKFEIKEDILSRTLVLFGAGDDEEEFQEYFASIESESKRLRFKVARCKSVDDVKGHIENIKPDFLIFDCHGAYDESTMSSYLLINDEKLTGADIVKYKISAPIVFLSACHTNPNYGYLNKLADAFFEAGCLSVTATYFPISIANGTNLYYRVLLNLANAVKYSVHRNWLAFISHILRTSYYKDIINETTDTVTKSVIDIKLKSKILKDLKKLNVDTGLHIMKPSLRIEAMEGFFAELEKVCPKEFISRNTVPEFPFYTNMGRGDLIEFSNWRQEFKKQNLPNSTE